MLSRLANHPRWLSASAVVVLAVCSTVYGVTEHKGVMDSLWWGLMTATTVGYGDTFPTTSTGRAMAAVLVFYTLLFFLPLLTAGFASKLIVNRDAFTHEEQEQMKSSLEEILRRLG